MYCSENVMEYARGSSFGWQHLDGNYVLEACEHMGSRIWRNRVWTLTWDTIQWCFDDWNWRVYLHWWLIGTNVRNRKNFDCWQNRNLWTQGNSHYTDQLRWSNRCWIVTLAFCFERVLRRRPRWRLGNAKMPIWNHSHMGNAIVQAQEHDAKHHDTKQWRVWKLRIAQVISSQSRNRSNVERLVLRSEERDPYALRWQRDKIACLLYKVCEKLETLHTFLATTTGSVGKTFGSVQCPDK